MKPYLTIVIPSRNDNHGGDLLERMQTSLNGLIEQLENYKIDSEIILIDWNPPEGKVHLKDAIKWPKDVKYCTIKFIEVLSAIHQKIQHSDKLPIYVVGAINCGVRRARGEFVLPRPIDLLYSDELMSFIANQNLKHNERYRVNRCDVNRAVLEKKNLNEQLEYCKNKRNIIRVHSYDPHYGQEGLPSMHTDASGDFQLMSKDFWHLLRGYREGDIISAYADPLLSYASYAVGVKEVVLSNDRCIYHIDHGDSFNDGIKIKRSFFERILVFFFNPVRSFLPVFMTRKMLFWYQKLVGKKRKTEVFGIPTMDYMEHLDLARSIISGKRPYFFNDENWGLGQEVLPEFVVKTADWDKK